MSLSGFADRSIGHYGCVSARSSIEGDVTGARLEFTYQESTARGDGWFEIAADGSTSHGQWRARGGEEWADWESSRVVREHGGRGLGGVWRTTYGALRLAAEGARVRGRYSQPRGALIKGDVEGSVLRASYVEPDSERGRALFELSDDGARFRGGWRAGESATLELDDSTLLRGSASAPFLCRVELGW